MCPAETFLSSVSQDVLQQAQEKAEHSASCMPRTLKQEERDAAVLGTSLFFFPHACVCGSA